MATEAARRAPGSAAVESLFARMRISRRLILGFGCLLLLALAMGVGALARMDQLDRLTRASYEQSFAIAERALQAEQVTERIRRLIREAVVQQNAGRRAALVSEIDELDAQLRQHLQELRQSGIDDRLMDQVTTTFVAWRGYRAETLRLADAGATDAAFAGLIDSASNPATVLVTQLDQLITHTHQLATEAQRASEAEYQQGRRLVVMFLLVLVLVGLVAAALITRSITRPLELLRERIGALAAARLDTEVPYQQQANELGDIARAVNVFKQSMVGLESQRWICATSSSARMKKMARSSARKVTRSCVTGFEL
jgi:methyl-accepting chemotaxis protein